MINVYIEYIKIIILVPVNSINIKDSIKMYNKQ